MKIDKSIKIILTRRIEVSTGRLVRAKIKKPKCCGGEVGDMTSIKLGEKECTVAVFVCKACGRIFDELRAPLVRDGKKTFLIGGKIETR